MSDYLRFVNFHIFCKNIKMKSITSILFLFLITSFSSAFANKGDIGSLDNSHMKIIDQELVELSAIDKPRLPTKRRIKRRKR